MRRLLAAFLIAVSAALLLLVLVFPWFAGLYRDKLLAELSQRAGMRVVADDVAFSMIPPGLIVHGLSIEKDQEFSVAVESASIQLRPLQSFRSAAIALDARLDGGTIAFVDDEEEKDEEDGAQDRSDSSTAGTDSASSFVLVPPIVIEPLDIRNTRLAFSIGEPADLEIGALSGRLAIGWDGSLSTDGLTLEATSLASRKDRLPVEQGHLRGRLDRHGLFLDDAKLRSDRLHLSASRGSDGLHRVRGWFDAALIGVFVDDFELLTGRAEVDASLGDLLNPPVDLQLNVADLSIGSYPVGSLATRMRRISYEMHFDDIEIRGLPGVVTGYVGLDFHDPVRLWGDVETATAVDPLLRVFDSDAGFEAALGASVTIDGTLDGPDLTIEVDGSLFGERGAERTLQGRSRFTDLGGRVEASVFDGTHQELVSSFQVRSNRVAGLVEFEQAVLRQLIEFCPGEVRRLPIGGMATGSAAFSVGSGVVDVAGDVQITDPVFGGVALVDAESTFRFRDDVVSFERFDLRAPAGTIRAVGSLASQDGKGGPFSIRVQELSGDTFVAVLNEVGASSLPLKGGEVSGDVELSGRWSAPRVRGHLRGVGIAIAGMPTNTIEAHADLQEEKITLTVDGSFDGEGRLRMEASGKSWSAIQAKANAEKVPIQWRIAEDETVEGFANLVASLRNDVGDATVDLRDLRFGEQSFPDARIVARLAKGVVKGDAGIGDLVSIQASYALDGPGKLSAVANFRDFEISRTTAAGDAFAARLTGRAAVDGPLSAPRELRGSLAVSSFELRHEESRWQLDGPVEYRLEREVIRLAPSLLVGPKSSVRFGGEIGFDGRANLEASGDASLSLLELVGEPIAAANGSASFGLEFRREPQSSWHAKGNLKITDGSLDLGWALVPSGIYADIEFSDDAIRWKDFTGKLGGGRISLSGESRVGLAHEIAWKLDRVRGQPADDLEVSLSGSGTIAGEWAAPVIAGEIDLHRAVYSRDVKFADLFPGLRRAVAPRRRERAGASPIRLDLRIRSSGDVFLDNNLAEVESALDLRVTGPANRPAFEGVLTIQRGQFTLADRVFTMLGGTIVLADPARFDPVLNLASETRIETPTGVYTVSLAVEGSAENPRIRLGADDPTLSQNDVFSLVAFGSTTDGARGGGGTAINALALLPGMQVEETLVSWVGIDRFEVRAAENSDTGSVEPQIRLGKRITDDLQASVASSLGVRTRRWIELEYSLTRRISLLGTWEEETSAQSGAFGGAVKFRHQFRKPYYSLLPAPGDESQQDAPRR